MTRRELLALLAVSVTGPFATEAQQAEKVYRIGVLGMISAPAYEQAFRTGLRDRGYVEGRNVTIESRWAEGRPERLPELAREIIRSNVDVIVTASNLAARAAKDATQSVPIVMTAVGDPERIGLVASLARPGGNITGLTLDPGAELIGKLLELLKEAVPKLKRVALIHSSDPSTQPRGNMWYREGQRAARALGIALEPLAVANAAAVGSVLTDLAPGRVDALLTDSSALAFSQRRKIIDIANERHLPAAFPFRAYAQEGGLMAYGVDLIDLFHRTAGYVDRILRGARPGDLPVEQPIKFELVINPKTAKALGLTIPPSLLARADQVIE